MYCVFYTIQCAYIVNVYVIGTHIQLHSSGVGVTVLHVCIISNSSIWLTSMSFPSLSGMCSNVYVCAHYAYKRCEHVVRAGSSVRMSAWDVILSRGAFGWVDGCRCVNNCFIYTVTFLNLQLFKYHLLSRATMSLRVVLSTSLWWQTLVTMSLTSLWLFSTWMGQLLVRLVRWLVRH